MDRIDNVALVGNPPIDRIEAPKTIANSFVFIFFLLFAWQVGTYFYRNRPGAYRPDAPPAYLLPKG